MTTRAHIVGLLSLAGLHALGAQSLADRVAAVGTGVVAFHYAPRPGICGDGEHYIRTGKSSFHGSFSGRSSDYRDMYCVVGPVQVRLTLRDGIVERVQSWAGPLRSREATDLGVVSAPDAARYLLSIAANGPHVASAKAVLPAVLADSATVWPALIAIARDTDTRTRSTRQEALFWLSRFASGALAGRPNDPFADDDDAETEDEDLKAHAVFVLSQLPRGEGTEALLQVARSNPDRRVRSKALFWLGQSGDPRAIALMEAVLKG